MTNGSGSKSDIDQFQVAPRSGAAGGDLAEFERHLQSIPGAQILSRAGRPDQQRLIVNLPSDSFETLRARFGAKLIIERNAKLSPF